MGETSDGLHLLAAAKNYAQYIKDPKYVDVIELFIKEEQRHGGDLGRFLDLAQISRLQRNWGDTLFRKIRYAIPTMEIWTTPVIMVETLALVYYKTIQAPARHSLAGTSALLQTLALESPYYQFR